MLSQRVLGLSAWRSRYEWNKVGTGGETHLQHGEDDVAGKNAAAGKIQE